MIMNSPSSVSSTHPREIHPFEYEIQKKLESRATNATNKKLSIPWNEQNLLTRWIEQKLVRKWNQLKMSTGKNEPFGVHVGTFALFEDTRLRVAIAVLANFCGFEAFLHRHIVAV